MATAVATQPRLIQQTFDWEETPAVRPARPAHSTPSRVAVPTGRVTVPAVRETSCARRGKCEHVGGVMASVLNKYGIGLDDLLHAIEELRAARKKESIAN